MERTRILMLSSAVVVTGCAVSTEHDELGIAEQGLTPKMTPAWSRQFGTDQSEFVAGATTYGGNVYVAGSTSGALGIPSGVVGGFDGFVRKYDANGTIVWTRQFGSDEQDEAYAVVADATGVYVGGDTGTSPTYGLVIKFDHDGNELWRRAVAPDSGIVRSLAIDATGLYIAGQTSGQLTGQTKAGGLYDYDAFVVKFELTGNGVIWARQFGTDANDSARSVFVDGTGVYVAGQTGGGLGGTNAGGPDAFVRKYGLNGEIATPPDPPTIQFGTSDADSALAITGDASGIYVSSFTSKGDDANVGSLRKLDRSLVELWERPIAAGTSTLPTALGVDGSGVIVAGFTTGVFAGFENPGVDDLFVRKLDRRGRDVWAFQTGTASADQASALAIDGSAVYVGGGTNGALFSPNAGFQDAVVIKLVPSASVPTRRK